MTIAVLGDEAQWEDLMKGGINANVTRVGSVADVPSGADALLVLQEEVFHDFNKTTIPVLINSVCTTLKEMNAPGNVVRINGWNSFLQRSSWEIAGEINPQLEDVFSAFKREINLLPDVEGFVSPRIIAMIINEAYFALGDDISTKEEIDVAMKLGTNYPYGPFEWCTIIGVKRILSLLKKLATGDTRYTPAPLLMKEAAL